jgi:hypothetical protein
LEEIRDHYCNVADKFKPKKGDEKFDFRYPFYLGKADIVVDISNLTDDEIIDNIIDKIKNYYSVN